MNGLQRQGLLSATRLLWQGCEGGRHGTRSVIPAGKNTDLHVCSEPSGFTAHMGWLSFTAQVARSDAHIGMMTPGFRPKELTGFSLVCSACQNQC